MEDVTYESQDGIAVVTINRPDKKNAISQNVCHLLQAAWQRFEAGPDRVAVLTASGDKAFSVGADLNEVPKEFWRAIPMLGAAVTKPIVAATAGWVVGGGMTLVTFCDLCVAADTTRFLYPEARVGNFQGSMSSIISRMPHKIAMEVLLLGEELSVQRAYEVGFVNRIVPAGEEKEAAMAMARRIAANAPLVVAAMRELALDTLPKSPMETFRRTYGSLEAIATSTDAREGATAFLEKRAPVFRGE